MRLPGFWRIENAILDYRLSKLSKEVYKNPLSNFQIFGDPRGGTTWVMESLNSFINYPVLWEPLSIGNSKPFKKLGFAWRQFIPEDENWQEAKNAFEELYCGKILNHWICQQTKIEDIKSSKPFLIKFCRGNQLLPWLTKNFNFSYKPLYVVRHPFAVVASQLKQGGWDFHFTEFKIPDTKHNSFYTDHADFLRSIETKEESLAAFWCLCNKVPLESKKNDASWITVTYEDLLLNPSRNWEKITKSWSLDIDISEIPFRKRSSTALTSSPLKGEEQLEHWKSQFSSAQIKNMLRVLDYFQIKLYREDPLPKDNFI